MKKKSTLNLKLTILIPIFLLVSTLSYAQKVGQVDSFSHDTYASFSFGLINDQTYGDRLLTLGAGFGRRIGDIFYDGSQIGGFYLAGNIGYNNYDIKDTSAKPAYRNDYSAFYLGVSMIAEIIADDLAISLRPNIGIEFFEYYQGSDTHAKSSSYRDGTKITHDFFLGFRMRGYEYLKLEMSPRYLLLSMMFSFN